MTMVDVQLTCLSMGSTCTALATAISRKNTKAKNNMYPFYEAIDGTYTAETEPSAESMTNGLPRLLDDLRGQRK
jgi:hypothetical protein